MPEIQLTKQTFNPSNVLLQDALTGQIPAGASSTIIDEVVENSVVMSLARYEEMDKQVKDIAYFANGIGAYWVGEGQKIQTSKPTWVNAKLEAKKVGVIVPVSREYLTYSVQDFFNAIKPTLAQALYRKFDEAAILGIDNPFGNSVDKAATTAGSVVVGTIGEQFDGLESALNGEDLEVNGYVYKLSDKSAIKRLTHADNTLAFNGTDIDGVVALPLKSKEMIAGTVYAGDWDMAVYGIPFGISYEISKDAQLSTITNADGSPVNLYEQELMAIRVTMDVAFAILNDKAFARLDAAAREEAGTEEE